MGWFARAEELLLLPMAWSQFANLWLESQPRCEPILMHNIFWPRNLTRNSCAMSFACWRSGERLLLRFSRVFPEGEILLGL